MAYIKDKYYLGGDLYLGNLNKHIDYINEKLDSRISGLIVLNKEESAKYITYSPDDFLRRVISSEYNNRILIDLYTTEYGFEMTSLNNESAEDHMIYIALNLFNRYKVVSFRNTDKNILISLSEKFNKIIDTKIRVNHIHDIFSLDDSPETYMLQISQTYSSTYFQYGFLLSDGIVKDDNGSTYKI